MTQEPDHHAEKYGTFDKPTLDWRTIAVTVPFCIAMLAMIVGG